MFKRITLVAGFVLALATLLPRPALAKEQTVTLKIKGWHCGGCAVGTAAKIKEVKGVKDVSTSLPDNTAKVTFDDPATFAQLEKAVGESGYTVEK